MIRCLRKDEIREDYLNFSQTYFIHFSFISCHNTDSYSKYCYLFTLIYKKKTSMIVYESFFNQMIST